MCDQILDKHIRTIKKIPTNFALTHIMILKKTLDNTRQLIYETHLFMKRV